MYNVLKSDLESHPNHIGWVYNVKRLLSRLGFYDVWLNQGVGDVNIFLNILKTRLYDIYQQDWNASLQESSRALFYRTISSFNFQNYLNVLNVEKYRKAMSRLRMSSHRLEIETGRWRKPISTPIEQRKCKFCNVLEDEFHFIIECTLYADLRRQYINRNYWVHPNYIKFVELINTANVVDIKKLASYIYYAFEKRTLLLSTI